KQKLTRYVRRAPTHDELSIQIGRTYRIARPVRHADDCGRSIFRGMMLQREQRWQVRAIRISPAVPSDRRMSLQMRPIFLSVAGSLALAAIGARAEDRAGVPDARQFDDSIRPFLVQHCQECHSGDKAKGGLRLDELGPNFDTRVARERWLAVRNRVQA